VKYSYYLSFGLSVAHSLQKYIEVSPVYIIEEQSQEERIGRRRLRSHRYV
jgi:hypothetical protein